MCRKLQIHNVSSNRIVLYTVWLLSFRCVTFLNIHFIMENFFSSYNIFFCLFSPSRSSSFIAHIQSEHIWALLCSGIFLISGFVRTHMFSSSYASLVNTSFVAVLFRLINIRNTLMRFKNQPKRKIQNNKKITTHLLIYCNFIIKKKIRMVSPFWQVELTTTSTATSNAPTLDYW